MFYTVIKVYIVTIVFNIIYNNLYSVNVMISVVCSDYDTLQSENLLYNDRISYRV